MLIIKDDERIEMYYKFGVLDYKSEEINKLLNPKNSTSNFFSIKHFVDKICNLLKVKKIF